MNALDDQTAALDAVVGLVDTLLDDFDVVELLTDLTVRCVDLLDVASAGLLLGDARGHLHLMAATSENTQALELFQLQADEGPCLECYSTGEPVSVADLQAEAERWPRFAAAATEQGFASVHAVPMRAAGTVLGSLGLFGSVEGPLDRSDQLIGQTLAHVASVAILQERAPTRAAILPQLRNALASRIVVEQAKGFLRGRLDISVDEAFSLMRAHAHARGEHLTDVARGLISDSGRRAEILEGIEAARSTG